MSEKTIKSNEILSSNIKKLIVYDELNAKELAVITKDIVTTANDNIVIKIMFES